MRTRPLGPGGPEVSLVGFGGMPLSITDRPEEDDAVRALHAGLDAGVTLIDTADVYCLSDADLGHNERLVARALREWSGPRDTIVVATKGGLTRPDGRWVRNGRPDHLRRACDRSLTALGVEQIALYQFHAPDPDVPFEESIGQLAELARAGKVRWLGLSNVTVEQLDVARALTPILTVQNRLNPFFREAPHLGVVARCAELGIGYLAYSPVGGGRLNRKLPEHPVVSRLARHLGVSPHRVVLAWVLAQGPTVLAIPGARTPEHARDSAEAAALQLDPDMLAELDAAEFSIA